MITDITTTTAEAEDYTGEDGLLYCGKCHTPKAVSYTHLDVYKRQVLDRYAGYIRYFSKMNGYYNSDMEDYIRTKLIESLFKFRLDR